MKPEFPMHRYRPPLRLYRHLVTYGKFLIIEGKLQNQENVISVKADSVRLLEIRSIEVRSHDFH